MMQQKKLSSVFFGTPEFALPSLEAALKTTNVLAVVTQPDRPRGRGQQLSPCPIKARALKEGLRVFSPPSLRKDSAELREFEEWIAQHAAEGERPDFLFVTAYGNILPQKFLDWPKIGPINVHASLLPRWRGAAPIQRCLEMGDSQTGVSLQKMVFELDAGDVLAEENISLDSKIAAAELTEKLSALGGTLLERFVRSQNENSALSGRSQALDSEKITFAAKITKEEGFWSPDWTATTLHNKVRAFSVWPGVKARLGENIIKIAITELSPDLAVPTKLAVGELKMHENKVILGCYSDVRASEPNYIVLSEVQLPSKPVGRALDVLRNLLQAKTQLKLGVPDNSKIG